MTDPDAPVRVLFIDDEPGMLHAISEYLMVVHSLEVDITSDPVDAVQSGQLFSYDCVVVDYDMPEMDGITLLKAIRSADTDIPVIVLTGKSREEVVIEAINNGADFYLQKGGDPKPLFTELANAVRHLVRRSQAEDSAIRNEKYWSETRAIIFENLSAIEESTQRLRHLNKDLPDTENLLMEIMNRTKKIQAELEKNSVS